MIDFLRLEIGQGGVRPCPRCARGQGEQDVPASIEVIEERVAELISVAQIPSVMMDGFEPFQHPELPRIVAALKDAGVRRIGMCTDAAGLMSPHDARGCIEAGVRVFEVPLLPDALGVAAGVSAPPLQASLQGIARIREVAQHLGVFVFVSAAVPACSHSAPHFAEMVQAAINAGVDGIRVECASPGRLIDKATLSAAHDLATQAAIAFFGDGCEDYLLGTPLYTINAISEQQADNG